MASKFQVLLALVATLLLIQPLAEAQTCADCFITSRAAYYPNSNNEGTSSGACGFGSFGATVNGGDVSAVSDLYRNGLGCGACYQVRCTNSEYCSDNGITVVVTDQGSGDNTDFILSSGAFSRMAQNTDAAPSLLALGVVEIQYRRWVYTSYGAVWTTTSPPSGALSLRMLVSGDDGDETWLVPVNDIPQDWKAGETTNFFCSKVSSSIFHLIRSIQQQQ